MGTLRVYEASLGNGPEAFIVDRGVKSMIAVVQGYTLHELRYVNSLYHGPPDLTFLRNFGLTIQSLLLILLYLDISLTSCLAIVEEGHVNGTLWRPSIPFVEQIVGRPLWLCV